MIIKRLHIDSFGKFNNYDLSLDNGFTVLFGNNEDGKSTLMAFIQMMFYGYNRRVTDVLRNPRKRYKPWDGREMKGYIEFEASGVDYRLERSFGGSNATDKITAWNLDRGEQVRLPRDQDPGQIYFKMGAEAFEKSVFIGQSGSVIGAEESSGEITQRLLNLVTTGNEDISHRIVEQRLQTAAQAMVSKGKAKGILIDQRTKFDQLKNNLIEAEQEESEKASIISRINQLADEKCRLELEKGRLEESLQIFDLIDQKNRIDAAIVQKQNLNRLISLQNKRRAELLRQGSLLDDEYLKAVEKQIIDLEQIEYRLMEAGAERDQIIKAGISLTGSENRLLPQGAEQISLEQAYELADLSVKKQEDAISRLDEDIDRLTRDLEQARQVTAETQREIYSAEAELTAAGEAGQSLVETCEERIQYAKDRLEEAQRPRETKVQTPARRSAAVPLTAALLIIAAGVVLGMIIDPLLYLIIIAAIVPVIQIVRPVPLRSKTIISADDQLIRQLSERLRQEQDEYTTKQKQVQDRIFAAEQNLNDLKIKSDQKSTVVKELEAALDQSKNLAKKAKTEYSDQLRLLENLRTHNEAVRKYEIKINQTEEQYEAGLKKFLADVSRFRPVTDWQQAKEAVDQLRQLLTEIKYADITVNTYVEKQSELEKSHTLDDLAGQSQRLQNKIGQLSAGELPVSFDEDQFNSAQAEIKRLNMRISALGEQIASEEASVREKYRHKKNVSQIQDEIEQVREILFRQESDYEALCLAVKVLDESFDELQKNFGPMVNDKTAGILSRLTDGKYSKVRVSRGFDIMIEDRSDNRLHEWGFLSSGTIDQAYLALRLAITELVSDRQASLPLLLDDVFSQYDDNRALQGMRFISQYSNDKQPPLQILLFTCHRRIANWAGNELEDVQVKTIV
jgi:DNA repair exonuclease SbcCD ATPase subunit